ncbi:DUF5060 domain-containing protein [Cohnella sp. LGH]|uniref:DUF5060 domain-containing protein n=1 Tax=Cohnella sp. LGH TaxID=1619153 RepID=UPI001ADB6410|nr:DUF5060 domain-containing protein [Cohnella sp. LGH]QTH40983.1 DUF5060 domain-containing protein [Cohnella sp. LGH]
MRNFVRGKWSMVAVLTGQSSRAHAETYSGQTWKMVEIPLTSSKSYTNSYTNFDVNATFSGLEGVTMTMPGFWDGGSTWLSLIVRSRFIFMCRKSLLKMRPLSPVLLMRLIIWTSW